MKKIFYIIVLLGGIVNAQVAIGKEDVTNESIILEFDDNDSNTLGIILPTVTNSNNVSAQNGTFVYDINTKKVRMYEKGSWKDLSGTGDSTKVIEDTSNENSNATGVIIGSETSTAQGILVLESSNKAMVLPKIADPHVNVKSPYPGMMCYDTESKTVAVFDGINWNYWK